MSFRRLIAAQTDMFMTLAHRISSSKAKDCNLIFSPLSIHVVLSLIAAGSSRSTRDQLLPFLGSESTDDLNKFFSKTVSRVVADGGPLGGPILRFANGAWLDQTLSLKHSFKDVVTRIHGAECQQVDFINKPSEVISTVNLWGEKQTNGLVKEVLPPHLVDNVTRLILANALYFKGTWRERFNKSATKQGEFHLLNGGSVKVHFMTTQKEQFLRTYEDCKVLRLPYKQGRDHDRKFSMYVFLPHEANGLPTLMDKIKSQPGFLNNHLPFDKVRVGDFKLPRFKFSFGSFEISKILKGLGVDKPFLPGGLTEMVDSSMGGDKLYVASIFQKAFIEVNEDGTEAAAVTASGYGCARPKPAKDFVADHPFMFIIREDTTGVLLFIGHVMNPSI